MPAAAAMITPLLGGRSTATSMSRRSVLTTATEPPATARRSSVDMPSAPGSAHSSRAGVAGRWRKRRHESTMPAAAALPQSIAHARAALSSPSDRRLPPASVAGIGAPKGGGAFHPPSSCSRSSITRSEIAASAAASAAGRGRPVTSRQAASRSAGNAQARCRASARRPRDAQCRSSAPAKDQTRARTRSGVSCVACPCPCPCPAPGAGPAAPGPAWASSQARPSPSRAWLAARMARHACAVHALSLMSTMRAMMLSMCSTDSIRPTDVSHILRPQTTAPKSQATSHKPHAALHRTTTYDHRELSTMACSRAISERAASSSAMPLDL